MTFASSHFYTCCVFDCLQVNDFDVRAGVAIVADCSLEAIVMLATGCKLSTGATSVEGLGRAGEGLLSFVLSVWKPSESSVVALQ